MTTAPSQMPSQWGAQRGSDTTTAASRPTMPMTMPDMPGTSMELEDSMEARMYASVPSARLSIAAGASE
jgi:hypothetical protein